jgi:hypothetical protein
VPRQLTLIFQWQAQFFRLRWVCGRKEDEIHATATVEGTGFEISARGERMIPTRVSHNPIIGPGVVPFGVDPAYDAQYKLNQAPRSHVASHGQGKPFTVEPGPHQRTQ